MENRFRTGSLKVDIPPDNMHKLHPLANDK